jgi:superfamily II DNA or RNA helicase
VNKVKARLNARFIRDCNSWDDLYTKLKVLVATDKKEAGDTFEVFVQAYLRSHSEYRTRLNDVWLLHEVPPDVREQLGDLFQRDDEGTDLIARTRHGQLWAIQAKFVGGPGEALTRGNVDSFISYGFHTLRDKFALGLIAHISTKPIKKRHLMPNIRELGLDRWRALDDAGGAGWRDILQTLKRGEPARPKRRQPKPHQKRAIAAAVKHFAHEARGRLKMACGTGKSLIGLWVARALKAETILVVTPSLQLIQRAVEDWSREYLAYGEKPDWMCVCSDDTVVDDVDDFVTDTYESGLPTCTDAREVADRLRGEGTKIIFTTYQSSDVVAEAARLAGVTFDFAVFDEAHKTVGRRDKAFGRLLREDFKVKRRMFMTATERIVNGGDADEVYSMDNEEDYGKRFYDLEFGDAIEQGLISPFQVLTIVVSEKRIKTLIDRNRILNVAPGLDEVKARDLAVAVALNEAIKKHGIKKAIAYCASILAGKHACARQDALNKSGRWPETANFHVSSELTAGERADVIRKFEDATRPAIMYNARCLTEGVDIGTQKDRPVDAVAFTSPRRSVIDIVQAAGRAMRKGSRKKVGYVLIPIIVPDDMDFDKFAETTPFKEMARIIKALAIADPRIVDELRALYYGKVPTGKIIKIEGEPIGLRMPFDEFASALRSRVWDVIARGNWRPFEEARAFARQLGLSGEDPRRDYAQSDGKPRDIPASPQAVYKNDWISWGDWLGNGQRRGGWRPLEETRAFVQTLKLKNNNEWRVYAKSENRPEDIPVNPEVVYRDSGWIGWGDFLGNGRNQHGNWRAFEDARRFARSLKLDSIEGWYEFCRSKKRPADIPVKPNNAYVNSGWIDWGDWLGNGQQARILDGFRPFPKAKAFVRTLNIENQSDWYKWTQSGAKPDDIPARPEKVYADKGWISYGDWLGNGRRKRGDWRPFKQARVFVRTLGLRSQPQWKAYCKSGEKPADIPRDPNRVYADDGWIDYNDWLDTDGRRIKWRPFKQARAFVRTLEFKNSREWRAYSKSDERPADIPSDPALVYVDDGWIGSDDWIGKATP